jgi:hypothetical protein
VETADFCGKSGRPHGAHEDEVCTHLFLRDDDLFLSVADEVAAWIQATLPGRKRHVARAANGVACHAANHARQATEQHLAEEFRSDNAIEKLLLKNVHVDGQVVRKASDATFVRR